MCQGRPMKRKNTMMTNPPTSSLRSPPEGLIHTISPDIYASPAAAPATNNDNDNNENAPDISINNTMTIQEDATCYVLSIKLPNGVNGNDVGVSLQGNILTISGYRRRQYCSDASSSFPASSLLSSNVDDDAASSSSSTISLFDYHRHKSHSNNSNSSSNNMNNNSNDMNIDNDNAYAYAYGVTATVSPPSSDSELDQQYQYQQQQQQHQHTIDNNNHYFHQNYSSTSSSSRSAKRQRLVNQEFEIDTTAIDLDRAIANTWNGSLTLYAPKKQQRSR